MTCDSLAVRRLDPDLPLPRRAHPGDGGLDLYSRITARLRPGERLLVPTGIAVAVPFGFAGWVVPRSGLAHKFGITVANAPGLIDHGFTGEACVLLVHHGNDPVTIERATRIAQLVIAPIALPSVLEVDRLEASARGGGGFGSTGTA